MHEPCMCGADDCPRCFPSFQLTFFDEEEDFEVKVEELLCVYCGGVLENEHCLDQECEGA